MDTGNSGPGERGRLAPQAYSELEWPFCGDEYPPLRGSPGAVVCTKPRHPVTEVHLNEETGWVWRSGRESWLPSRAGKRPRLAVVDGLRGWGIHAVNAEPDAGRGRLRG